MRSREKVIWCVCVLSAAVGYYLYAVYAAKKESKRLATEEMIRETLHPVEPTDAEVLRRAMESTRLLKIEAERIRKEEADD